MRSFYIVFILFSTQLIKGQGIEMDYSENSPSLRMVAQYDSLEFKNVKYFSGGSVSMELVRTDSNYAANIFFDLSSRSIHGGDNIALNEEGLLVEENWNMGIKGDDRFRISHYRNENRIGSNGTLSEDVLVLDADEEGSHENPIIQMPQGRLHIGDDIKLYATSENKLVISGGDVVPSSFLGSGYDLGKNALFSHWDEVVANDFITYSLFPDIVLAKSQFSSLDILEGINTYQARDEKSGISNRMMLSPKELKKIFPEALHLRDVQHNADGTTEIIEIENPGIICDRFIPLLIDGMQEQKELIDKQAA